MRLYHFQKFGAILLNLVAGLYLLTITEADKSIETLDGQMCDPEEFEPIADLEDDTRYWTCDLDTRYRLGSSRLSESCIYNTDCLQNSYCFAGSCVCISGFVEIGEECIPAINPGQSGCIYDRQCIGAWPSTTCKMGVCQCPPDQFAAETRDGVVCVKAGQCPLPDGYTGAGTLDQLTGINATCQYGETAAGEKAACFANGQYVGDIYDCIPKTADLSAAADGLCCPSRALTCIQPKAASLDGIETRYWYNSITGQCESFMWSSSGNVGNSNNFRTPDQCMAFCAGICARGPPQMARGKSVRCATAEGQCDSGHYSCSAHSGQDRRCCPLKDFICSPTGGRLYVGPQPSGPDAGIAPIASSTGGSAFGSSASIRWFFDRKAGRCIAFEYKGLAGNFNNFLNENDCQTFCGKAKCEQGEPLKDYYGNDQDCNGVIPCPNAYECRKNVCCPKTQTICIQPKFISSASCGAASRQRFWFNAKTRDCEEFNDGGCRGNDNNFESYTACMGFCGNTKSVVKCMQGEPDKDSSGQYRKCNNAAESCRESFECYHDGFAYGCCPTKEYICKLPAESGKACSTSTVRWFFDYNLHICRPFEYLGCDGNGNNFVNRRECERFCGSGVQIGCPYGGVAGEDSENWSSRLCDAKAPKSCGNGQECMKIFVNGQFSNYCCPTRAFICRMEQKAGDKCATSPASRRYFFNHVTKECEEFSYRGCNGNENNFVTMSQCSNFCHASACKYGETVYIDPSTKEPLACRVSAAETTCPAGFSCVHSDLLNRSVCCGASDLGACPAGEKAFIDAITQDPKECRSPGSKDECPTGFRCHPSGPRKFYCCSQAVVATCPPGRALYRDLSTQQPQLCEITKDSRKGGCPLGFSCYSEKSRGVCCATDTELKKDPSVSGKACPRGYIGFKQPGTGVVRTCQATTVGKSTTSTCPLGYACVESPMDGKTRCCGVSGGCAYPTVAYINSRTGQPMRCRQGGMCPQGYICKPVSPGTHVCCSTVAASPEEAEELDPEAKEESETEEFQIVISSKGANLNLAPKVPRCANYVEKSGEDSVGKTKSCNAEKPDSCPVGYECEMAANVDVDICCKVARSVCDGSQSIPYMNPASRKPQSCVSGSSNKCPSGYRCSFSSNFEKFYCCSTSDICPVGYRAFLPASDPLPQRCTVAKGKKNPCPKSYSCMYSRLLRDYVCCTRASPASHANPVDPDTDTLLEKRAMCAIPCSSHGMHAGRVCPHGFRCENVGGGTKRCCPLDGSTDDIGNEKEPHEIEPQTYNICDHMEASNSPEYEGEDEISETDSPSILYRPSVWQCRPSDPGSCTGRRECRYLGQKHGFRCCPLSTIGNNKWVIPPGSLPMMPPVVVPTQRPVEHESCRTGAPYTHPVTKTPLVCNSVTGYCPIGYFCEYSDVARNYVCCPRPMHEAREPNYQPQQGGVFFVPGAQHGQVASSVPQFHQAQAKYPYQNYGTVYSAVATLYPPMWNAATPVPLQPPVRTVQSTMPTVVMEESETLVAPRVEPAGPPELQQEERVLLVPLSAAPLPSALPFPTPVTCDLREKKRIGQECCHESQCGARYPCRWFAGRSICRCPLSLILDMTVYPFQCTTSCSHYLHDSVCTLKKQQ